MYNIKHKNKTPVREMDVFKAILLCIYLFWLLWRHPFFLLLNYFSRLLFHVTGNTPSILKSIRAELYSSYFVIAYFYPSFPLVSTVSEANSGTLVFTMQYLVICGTPSRASGRQMIPNPFLREAENIPRGGKYLKYILLLTYLAYIQPI